MPVQTRIILRTDSAANWASVNPVLANGEVGHITGTVTFKVGDGATAWNALPLASGSPGADGAGVPVGGTTGQVLAKASATDFDTAWVTGGGGGGVTDHGALTGLADDDHTQYHTDARGDARYSALGHGHAQADVTGLAAALAGKAATSHSHAQSDVTNLVTDLAGKAPASHTHAQGDVTGLVADLAGKAAASHTHTIANVTGLQTALDSKVDDSQVSAFGATLIDDADATAARTTLGLGTAATSAASAFQSADADLTALAALDATVGLVEQTGAAAFTKRAIGVGATTSIPTRADADARFAAVAHTHAAADIASGVIATARLGSGTADGTTFLRGDNTWATPAGGGGGFVLTAATITVSPAAFGQAEFAVADAAMAPTSLVFARLAPNAEHDADDLAGHDVFVQPDTGVLNGVLTYDGPLVGDYRILYSIG